MVTEIVIQYLLGVVLLIVFYLAGGFFNRVLFPGKTSGHEALNLFTGLLIVSSLYAMIVTRLDTIQSCLILVLLMILALWRGRIKMTPSLAGTQEPVKKYSRLLPLAVFYNFWFLVQLFIVSRTIYYGGEHFVFTDVQFYAEITENLKKFGAENTIRLASLEPGSLNSRTPYHYIELWLTSLISVLTGQSSIKCFCLLMPVLLYTTATKTLYDIIRQIAGKGILAWLAPLLVITTPFFNKIVVSGGDFPTIILVSLPKGAILVCCVLSEILWYQRAKRFGGIFLTMMLFVNPLSWPFVAGVFALYTLADIRRNRKFRLTTACLFPLAGVITFLAYYYYHSRVDAVKMSDSIASIPHYDYKLAIRIFLGAPIQSIVAYLPLFLLPILILRKDILKFWKANLELQTIIFAVLAGTLFAATAYGALNFIGESFQFYQLIALPVINILWVVVLCYAIAYKKDTLLSIPGILTTVVAVACFYFFIVRNLFVIPERTSKKFIQELKSKIPLDSNASMTGFYLSGLEYQQSAAWHTDLFVPGQYLKILNKDIQLVNLNVIDAALSHTAYDSLIEAGRLRESAIYHYSLKSPAADTAFSPALQEQFIKEHRIQLLLFTKGTSRPSYLDKLVKDSLVNELNGDRIFILK